MTTTTRRSITKGAAWAVPAVMTVATAPAIAASTTAGVTLSRYTQYSAPTTGCSSGYKLHWDGTTAGMNGVTIKNARSSPVTVSGLYIVFLVSVDNLSLAADAGYTKWSAPKSTGVTQTINNTLYYQYRSTYSDTVTVAANSTGYVQYSFTGSICRTGTTYITGGQAFATIGGATIQSPASSTFTTCTTNNCQ